MSRPQQILHAASRLFSEQGFDTVSIDEIGKAAGVSGPAIYRHFSGRTAILQGVCELTMERLFALVGEIPEAPEAALAALVRGQVRLALDHPELICAFEIERALPNDVRRRFRRRQRDHAKRWIAAIRALQPSRDAQEITVAVYAAIGLAISAARWPRDVRQSPNVEDVAVATAYAALGLPQPERASAK